MKQLELKIRLNGAEVLRTLKEIYSYQELSKLTKLSPQILLRYIKGQFLPSLERAELFTKIFKEKALKKAILRNIEIRENIIVNVKLLSNIRILNQIAKTIITEIYDKGITAIVTKETDGVPLATLIANKLEAKLVVAKNRKEPGIKEFIEVKQVYSGGLYDYIYIPKNIIRREEKILIIDDIVRTGSTIRALVEACLKEKAKIIKIFTIISVGEGLNKIGEEYGIPVEALVKM